MATGPPLGQIFHSNSAPPGSLPQSTYTQHDPIPAPSLADFRSLSYPVYGSDASATHVPYTPDSGSFQSMNMTPGYGSMSPPPSPSKKRDRDEPGQFMTSGPPAAPSSSALISPTSTVFEQETAVDDDDEEGEEDEEAMEVGETSFRLNTRSRTASSNTHVRHMSSSSSIRDGLNADDDYVDGSSSTLAIKRAKKARTSSAASQQRLLTEVIDDDDGKGIGRRKIQIEYIQDKSRRHITFSKRKAGIMKKAYELSTLTGTQVLLLVVSETGTVYTYSTSKLQPLVTETAGKNLIRECLDSADGAHSNGSTGSEPKGGQIALKAKSPSKRTSASSLRNKKSASDIRPQPAALQIPSHGSHLQQQSHSHTAQPVPSTSSSQAHGLTMQDVSPRIHHMSSQENLYRQQNQQQQPSVSHPGMSVNPQSVFMPNSAQMLYSHQAQQLAQNQMQRAVASLTPQQQTMYHPTAYLGPASSEAYL